MSKTFLWIEDRKGKASYTFWENLMKQLYPGTIVESKKNNSVLEFKELIDWVYAPQDELLKKRESVAAVRKKLVESIQNGNFQYKEIQEIMEYDSGIEEHNIEQLVAKLLFDLTRNTGFEVSKGTLGECWTKSCCEWEGRQEDDICGLDYNRLSVFNKMKSICEESSLKEQFFKIGLEILT